MGFDPLPVVLDRLQWLEVWGQGLAASGSPAAQEVDSTLRLLSQHGLQLEAAWEQRWQWLQEGLELQRFSQELNGFAATCANHEAFLHLDTIGVGSQAGGGDGADHHPARHDSGLYSCRRT